MDALTDLGVISKGMDLKPQDWMRLPGERAAIEEKVSHRDPGWLNIQKFKWKKRSLHRRLGRSSEGGQEKTKSTEQSGVT